MKIRGVESLERRGTHRLVTSDGSVVELRIAAVPMSTSVRISKVVPQPPVPQRVVGKVGDRKVEVDDKSPEYQQRMSEWVLLRSVAFAYHGLRHEEAITWDTPVSAEPTTREYRAIQEEMEGVGFSGEEIIRLAAAVRELATVTDEMLEDLSGDFSKARESEATSG